MTGRGVRAAILIAAGIAAVAAVVALVERGRAVAPAAAPRVIAIEAPAAGPAILASVGDTLLGAAAEPLLVRQGSSVFFAGVRPALVGADAIMANLEAPITSVETPAHPDKEYVYKQLPQVARILAAEGFDLVGLANNHALDYGVEGLRQTIGLLESAGVATVGAGDGEAEARRGVVLDFGRGRRVGVLAVMEPYGGYPRRGWFADGARPGVARAEPRVLAADVARLREVADVVIVHLHAGANYRPVTGSQERLARAAIDAGADAVNGHHPHVVQPIEMYRGKPILYSLGNYVFGTEGRYAQHGEVGIGAVARYHVGERGLERIELVALEVDNAYVYYRPRVASLQRTRAELLSRLAARGAPVRLVDGRVVLDLPPRR